jgi:transcriptional regulator
VLHGLTAISDVEERVELLPGTLDMLILQTLSHGPRHGYDIAKFINETSEGTFKILDGALYASLHRLERVGWVTSTWGLSQRGRRARFYELTPPGRNAFDQESRNWHRYGTAVALVMSAQPKVSAEQPR